MNFNLFRDTIKFRESKNLVDIIDTNHEDFLYGERAIADGKLICFDNPMPSRPYEIEVQFPEFTCLCPFSGYPDFAVLNLIYQPASKVLELKAMKLYINSFRNRRISHEQSTNEILDSFAEACRPDWMQLEAVFNARGNVHTRVRVAHGKKTIF